MFSGWWYTYPSEKYEFASWDDVSFSKPPTTYSPSNWNFQVQPACGAPSSNSTYEGHPYPYRDARRCAVRKIHLSICLIWAYWTNLQIFATGRKNSATTIATRLAR